MWKIKEREQAKKKTKELERQAKFLEILGKVLNKRDNLLKRLA